MATTPKNSVSVNGQPAKAIRAIAYLRVSSKTQVEKGTSLKEQREAIEKFCEQMGYVIGPDDWCVDEGISGRRYNRPGFNRLIELVMTRKYGICIVWRLDRSSRRESTGYKLKDVLEDTKTEFHSITQGHISSRMMFGFWLMHAAQESEDKSERGKMGARGRAKRGLVGARVVYGYRMSRKTGKPIIHVQESRAVQRIFQEYTAGVQTTDIVQGLIRDRIKTRYGKIWSSADIARVISTPNYYGVGYFGKTHFDYDMNDRRRLTRLDPESWVKIPYPQIVDREIWDEAQAIRKRNRHMKRADYIKNMDFPLRGIAWCASCGSRFLHKVVIRTRRVKGPDGTMVSEGRQKPGRAYNCQLGRYKNKERSEDKVCRTPHPTIGADKLEGKVWEKLRAVIEHPESVREMMEARKAQFDAEGSHAEMDKAQRNLEGIEKERQQVLLMFQKDYISESELDIKMKGINERRKMYQTEIQRFQAEVESLERYMGILDEFIVKAYDLKDKLDALTIEQRNRLITALVVRVEIGEEIKVYTILNPDVLTTELTAHRQ
jgi:DNA invertase Pin-like site-specific DNA recombinase